MKTIGFIEEHYAGTQFIGKLSVPEQPGRALGYAGKQAHTATEDIKIGRKRIKAGEPYTTIYYELQGR